MIYRRHTEIPIWHFCQNCSAWPRHDYQDQTIEPQREHLCAECSAKTEQLECEVVPEPGIS
jgi:hypothetical protein